MCSNSSHHMKNFLTSGNKTTEKAVPQMRVLLHIFKNLILIKVIKVNIRVFKMKSFRKRSKKNTHYTFLNHRIPFKFYVLQISINQKSFPYFYSSSGNLVIMSRVLTFTYQFPFGVFQCLVNTFSLPSNLVNSTMVVFTSINTEYLCQVVLFQSNNFQLIKFVYRRYIDRIHLHTLRLFYPLNTPLFPESHNHSLGRPFSLSFETEKIV